MYTEKKVNSNPVQTRESEFKASGISTAFYCNSKDAHSTHPQAELTTTPGEREGSTTNPILQMKR